MKKSRDQLIELIASEEARLTRLDAKRQTLNNQLYDLRGQLLAIEAATF